MERLTGRDDKGNAYFTKCFEEPCDGMGANEMCDECDGLEQVCERLAAYEDTGLTPEQLLEIDRMYREQCGEVKKLKEQLYEATVIDEDYEELAETVERFVRTDLLAHVISNILDEDRVKTIDDLTEYLNNELSCEV